MEIHRTHPSHITWQVPLENLREERFFQSVLVKNIRKTEKIITDLGYRIIHEPLTNTNLDEFFLLYKERLEKKPRGIVFPIHDSIQKGQELGKIYSIFRFLNPQGVCIGGLIIVETPTKDRISTAYKTLPHHLPERSKFRENIGYVFTYRFYLLALEKKYQKIFHGTDRNPYGFYSNIGLGMFKIRAGAVPCVASEKKATFSHVINYETDEDILLWLGTTPEAPITQAQLYTKKKPEEAREFYRLLWSLPNITIQLMQKK